MKKEGFISLLYLLVPALLGFQGCRSTWCHAPPDINIVHHGIFDSIPEGTRVVFESNTGKLDTAIYSPYTIIRKSDSIGSNTHDDCDDQRTNYQYESQNITFRNRFGMNQFRFGMNNEESDSVYIGWFISDNVYGRRRLVPINAFININNTYIDIARTNMINDSGIVKGYFLCSKKFGVVKVNYNDGKWPDTTFNLKYIIK